MPACNIFGFSTVCSSHGRHQAIEHESNLENGLCRQRRAVIAGMSQLACIVALSVVRAGGPAQLAFTGEGRAVPAIGDLDGSQHIDLESSAWLREYIKNSPEPTLLHPQLIPDLIMGTSFYAA